MAINMALNWISVHETMALGWWQLHENENFFFYSLARLTLLFTKTKNKTLFSVSFYRAKIWLHDLWSQWFMLYLFNLNECQVILICLFCLICVSGTTNTSQVIKGIVEWRLIFYYLLSLFSIDCKLVLTYCIFLELSIFS